jgi:transcriptional regulator with PAS, ATPase and Fis domain
LRARLIFATHQNLAEMVAQDKFRQDLYYRLNVIRINSPALREHPDDIPEIATYFLHHYSRSYQKEIEDIVPDAMLLLQAYSWPGNVRELENAIQSAIVLAQDKHIRPEDLPLQLQEADVIGIDEFRSTCTFERQIRDYKIKLATDAVREHGGNKTLAARSLNISRAYLHRLLRLDEHEDAFEESEENSPQAEAM